MGIFKLSSGTLCWEYSRKGNFTNGLFNT